MDMQLNRFALPPWSERERHEPDPDREREPQPKPTMEKTLEQLKGELAIALADHRAATAGLRLAEQVADEARDRWLHAISDYSAAQLQQGIMDAINRPSGEKKP